MFINDYLDYFNLCELPILTVNQNKLVLRLWTFDIGINFLRYVEEFGKSEKKIMCKLERVLNRQKQQEKHVK